MDITILLSVVLIIALIFLIFKIVKVFIRALFLLVVLFIAVSLVYGLLVYNDALKIRDLSSKQVTFIARFNNGVITGFTTIMKNESFKALRSEELQRIKGYLKNEDYGKVLGNTSRVFLFNEESLKDAPETYDFNDVKISKDEIITIIKSGDVVESVANIVASKKNLNNEEKEFFKKKLLENSSSDELRARLFALVISTAMEENKLFLIEEFRKKNLIVYPKTPVFTVLSIIPENKISKLFNTTISKIPGKT